MLHRYWKGFGKCHDHAVELHAPMHSTPYWIAWSSVFNFHLAESIPPKPVFPLSTCVYGVLPYTFHSWSSITLRHHPSPYPRWFDLYLVQRQQRRLRRRSGPVLHIDRDTVHIHRHVICRIRDPSLITYAPRCYILRTKQPARWCATKSFLDPVFKSCDKQPFS